MEKIWPRRKPNSFLLVCLLTLLQSVFIFCSTTTRINDTIPGNTETPSSTKEKAPDSTTPNISFPTIDPTPNTTFGITELTPTQKTNTTAGCSFNYTATVLELEFKSPNYPNNYDSNMHCEYRFNVSTSKKRAVSNYGIQLVFQSFELEYETYCLYDYIEIYDGGTTSDTFIGRYCGTDIPPKITGSKSTMLVIFSTDDSYTYKGFSSQYKEEDISYPNCKANYPKQINATSNSTLIKNNAYPGNYAENTDEYFLIINSGTLILQLVKMDIERAKGCIYDRITVYDGACPSFGILNEHCGTFLKRWELTGAEYLIQFHTDSSVQYTGFQMDVFLGVAGTGPPTTTTTTVGPPIEAEVVVMNEVLTNYSIDNFPRRDLSTPIGTQVDMFLVGINELDEVQQKLTTTVLIDARWQDDFLKWEPSKQGSIVKLLIPQNDIWKPDLALVNGFESLVQFGDKFMFVVVDSDGNCEWRPYQIMSSTCNVDMTNYPYDTQSCDLKFSTWSSNVDQVVTTIGAKGMEKHEYYVENTHWTLLSISQKSETHGSQSVVTFTLTLKRNPTFVVFYVAIPVVMLALLNTFTFALPPASGEKASFSMVTFLSFVVYVIVTYHKMPQNSDKISLFALYVLIMTFVSCLTVMITAFELRLEARNSKQKPVSGCPRNFFLLVTKLKDKILCCRNGNIRTSDAYKEDVSEQDSWQKFVSALDFVLFWLFLIITLGLTLFFLIYLAVQ